MTGLLIAGYRCGECQRWYFTNNKRANFQETQFTTVNMRKLCDGYHEKNALMPDGNNMGALWSGDVFIYTWFFSGVILPVDRETHHIDKIIVEIIILI